MTSRMTATDELRRLLDERGVEWWAEDDPEDPPYYLVTKWFSNASEQTFEEIPAIRSRSLKAFCVTPEQAIDATLGRGTCHDERVIAHVNGEKREEPDYLCDMCSNDCDERKTIRVGQSAYDVCEKWQEAEE